MAFSMIKCLNLGSFHGLVMPISSSFPFLNEFINKPCLFLEAQLTGTTQDHLQIFNIELKAKMKSHQMPEQVNAKFLSDLSLKFHFTI